MAWAWVKLADDNVGGLLNAPMKALANYLGLAETTLPVQDKVRTTNATVTTLVAVKIPVDTTVVVTGYVAARRTGGSAGSANDGAGYRVEFVATNSAGTAALIGAGSVTVVGESQAGWDVTLSASGATVLVRATGAANNNVTWSWSGKTLSVKE